MQRSTLRRKINREEHAAVPAELMKWIWAGSRKLKGLARRREAEAGLYLALRAKMPIMISANRAQWD
jgi:lysozyme